jgi:hypothetical protein
LRPEIRLSEAVAVVVEQLLLEMDREAIHCGQAAAVAVVRIPGHHLREGLLSMAEQEEPEQRNQMRLRPELNRVVAVVVPRPLIPAQAETARP